MKFALACSLFVGSEAVSTSDWEAYKQEFNKHYSDANGDEDGYRRGVFEQNLVDIAALNAREPLAEYGPTVFSDMTDEEFKAAYLSGYIPSNSTLLELPVDTSLELSASQDWTGKYTTPIKDQGHCGSCWAFSATEQVESDAMREHGWRGRLSTQELVDCTASGQGSKRGGCEGGNPTQGYKVLQALGGSASDNDYRYTHVDGTCKINSYRKRVAVASHKSVGRGSESTMKSYVGSTGPLSVCLDAHEFKNYKHGVKTSCGTSTDHCVQIVGYGTDAGTQYWKLRNSWASGFGENGFIRLKIGHNLCNVANDPTATSTKVLGSEGFVV